MTTEIKYTRVPTGMVRWRLQYEDGTNIHLFVGSENWCENNMAKAKKLPSTQNA
ncbi:hypothetical protein IV500_04810 [Paeniglutamicibacter antarcticus]|uniref:Uncharacterized protein n=1 Tax=Arthrobacter terrae TaxID=2935737 RepID=A0A931CNQ4_9MICC|nr:hypothetical protein [Arthrobacter terrae]MBG0738739.1 hypothetical protein [Arthrobacter terrae]